VEQRLPRPLFARVAQDAIKRPLVRVFGEQRAVEDAGQAGLEASQPEVGVLVIVLAEAVAPSARSVFSDARS
jgi:hypothetical protein